MGGRLSLVRRLIQGAGLTGLSGTDLDGGEYRQRSTDGIDRTDPTPCFFTPPRAIPPGATRNNRKRFP